METSIAKFQNLKDIIEGEGPFDARRASSLLNDLKMEALQWNFLTPEEQNLPIESRLRFRDLLEFEALLSIRTHQLDQFERAMAQLKCYYFCRNDLEVSERMPLLVAIDLVHVLAMKRLFSFNIEIDQVRSIVGENQYIDYVAELYESMFNNSFAKLSLLEKQAPSRLFEQFTAELITAARNKHADAIERAYERLKVSELQVILQFTSENETRQFIEKRNWRISENGEAVDFMGDERKPKTERNEMLKRSIALSVQISMLA